MFPYPLEKNVSIPFLDQGFHTFLGKGFHTPSAQELRRLTRRVRTLTRLLGLSICLPKCVFGCARRGRGFHTPSRTFPLHLAEKFPSPLGQRFPHPFDRPFLAKVSIPLFHSRRSHSRRNHKMTHGHIYIYIFCSLWPGGWPSS